MLYFLLSLLGVSFAIYCPQLPVIEPRGLAHDPQDEDGKYIGIGYRSDNIPPEWTCSNESYYEIAQNATYVKCDCECGTIDPDCGFEIEDCGQQFWEPVYDDISCNGNIQARDLFYCRLESSMCQILPPGLSRARGISEVWDCIPDVYNELSDPMTSLNDCDCNCGGFDPDCLGAYNDIYCVDYISADGTTLPRTWAEGPFCLMDEYGTYCETVVNENRLSNGALYCPQLPTLAPWQIVVDGYEYGNPPPGWECDRYEYYDGNTCNCECGDGVIDPDCGYELRSCSDQTWNPEYTTIKCGGVETYSDFVYCRIESGVCSALPPGLSRDAAADWTCIPDVYNELSDDFTSLNDCDCNCKSMDADCFGDFEDIYCLEITDENGAPMANPSTTGITCAVAETGVVCNIPLSTDTYVLPSTLLPIIGALVGITLCGLIFLVYFTESNKHTPLIKATSPTFCYILLGGAAVLSVGSLLFAVQPSEGSPVCALRVWVISVAVTIFIAPLLVKIYRLTQIFSQKTVRVVQLKDQELMKALGGLVGIMCLINLIFMVMTGFGYEEYHSETMNLDVDYTIVPTCSWSVAHLAATCGYVAALLCWGVFLAYKSRSMPSKFNETLPLLIVLGFILCYGLLIIPLQFMLSSNPAEVVILRGIGSIIGVWICVSAIYIPKLMAIYDDPTKGGTTSHESNTSVGDRSKQGKKKGSKAGKTRSKMRASSSSAQLSGVSTGGLNTNDNSNIEYVYEEHIEYVTEEEFAAIEAAHQAALSDAEGK